MSQSDQSTALIPVHPEDLAATAPDLLIGATLQETYKVVRFMAEGGMGRVYEAHHTRIASKRFAIKVLLAELTHSLDVRLRFRREAEAAASIDHHNVVGVHDFGYAPDGRPYLVCDYLEGEELADLLHRRGPLPPTTAVSIVRQICSGLEAAHDKGVIHRDLKPANVFIVGDGTKPDVRVLDFGLSRIVDVGEGSVTQTGVVMGTPSYMSPEQANGQRVDHRADVYGAGAILYAALTGKPPFEEETPHQTVLAVMSSEPVRPCSIVPSIPPELEVVVQKAMARSPDERYPSMKEFESALAPFSEPAVVQALRVASMPEIAGALPPGSLPRGADASDARGVRRRAAWWIFLACVLLVLGFASAAVGLVELLLPGRVLTPTELMLVALGVLGSSITPAILTVRYLRRRYWNNSAKMLELLAAIRSPVLTALAVYGVIALTGRVLDAMSEHLGAAVVPAVNASGWIGWAPFAFGIALAGAFGAAIRNAILTRGNTLFARVLAGPVALGLAGAGGVALALQGYGYQAERPAPIVAEQPATPAGTPQTKPDPARPAAAGPGTQAAQAPTPPPAASAAEPETPPEPGAPASEIEEATKSGVPALTALQAKYPKDPAVLDPLARALAKEPDRVLELLRVLDTLFTVAPEKAADEGLSKPVLAAALVTPTSARAIELMRERMGLTGAEMLFDIVIAQPDFRARAKAALESSEVQSRLSPALKIAYDIYVGPTCEARVAMLPQAIKDGDERALHAITLQTARTTKGCGLRKKQSCPGPCAQFTAQFDGAAAKIKVRLAKKDAGG